MKSNPSQLFFAGIFTICNDTIFAQNFCLAEAWQLNLGAVSRSNN